MWFKKIRPLATLFSSHLQCTSRTWFSIQPVCCSVLFITSSVRFYNKCI